MSTLVKSAISPQDEKSGRYVPLPELAGKFKFHIDDIRDILSVRNGMNGVDYIFLADVLN